MSIITEIKKVLQKRRVVEIGPREAYDLWSTSYDNQPRNLMLDLDKKIFNKLFEVIEVENKSIADIGCGTGRHWQTIVDRNPKFLTGFDVSAGMLRALKQKFSNAETVQVIDDTLPSVPDASFDILISTLTVAHINKIESVLKAWCRILKNNAEIIITDFHPQLLQHGGKRTFNYNHQHVSITNYIHPVEKIKTLFHENGFTTIAEEEYIIDHSLKEYYLMQNALHIYKKFEGLPVIYGLHLKRGNANQ